jgi:hypothetical protein
LIAGCKSGTETRSWQTGLCEQGFDSVARPQQAIHRREVVGQDFA